MSDEIKKILAELKQGLQKIFGDQLKAVILFGSYARGDAHPPDSDIDVMVVLKGEFDRNQMSSLSDHYVAELSLKYDVVISVRVASEIQYALSKFPLYINVRRDGVVV